MESQKTIGKDVNLKGVGIHTGHVVNITFKPAQPDSGVNFIRTDLPERPVIKVGAENVLAKSSAMRCSCIGKEDGAQVYTIEHLMAALCGLGIDNLTIEVDNDEVPGMDGSSLSFTEALLRAGIKEQGRVRQYHVVKEPVFVGEGESNIMILPYPGVKISYTLNYNHPLLKADFLELEITEETFKDELSPARTFCLEEEVNGLRGQGLGKGATYENTLVVGKNGVIKNRLRFENEFVRHKMLDLFGDLYILGAPLKGHIIALRSGHSLNLKLIKKLEHEKQRSVSSGITLGGTPEEGQVLDIIEIMKILPHREPFLFVDRILSLEKGKRAVGIKNVTINDYFFKGHFPGRPVMPGVIVIEAMAQVGGVMMLSSDENKGKIAYFMSINNAKFRKTVLPGDQLVFKVEAVKVKSKTGQLRAEAFVDDKLVAEADLMFILSD